MKWYVTVIFWKNNCIYLFLAVPSLRCCLSFFFSLVVASGGFSLLWCAGFALRWLLLLQSTGSRVGRRASVVTAHRLSGPATCGIFPDQTRDRTCIPCIGRWILNQWTTREVLPSVFNAIDATLLLFYLHFYVIDYGRWLLQMSRGENETSSK